MDILIKGMEMPEEHPLCIFICPDGRIVSEQHKPMSPVFDFCNATAVVLPEHGRLISDTDVKSLLRSGLSLDTDADIDHVCGLIDGLPTIVEANR